MHYDVIKEAESEPNNVAITQTIKLQNGFSGGRDYFFMSVFYSSRECYYLKRTKVETK